MSLSGLIDSTDQAFAGDAHGKPIAVTLVKTKAGYQLMRDGKLYFIRGAGGSASLELLRRCGGNSIRTWGADQLETVLPKAQKLGMTVTAGIWLGHKDQGFDYHNPQQVSAQLESVRQTVLRYRNSPALILWGLGNEMESGQEDDPAIWKAIEDIAAMVKKLDPNHPTMTVVAEVGGDKVAQINQNCPKIDIIGINSYAGAPSLPQRYQASGGVKPYVLTEFGPPGVWETAKNAWGVPSELSSTVKADVYRTVYEKAILHQPLCLGSYAFTWGSKQEATATWFGMLLPDGSRLAPVDSMTLLWSGQPTVSPCPIIHSLRQLGMDQVAAGTLVTAHLDATSPKNKPLKLTWVLQAETGSYHTGGGSEETLPTYPEAIIKSDANSVTVRMPSTPGGYRLYVYIRDTTGGAATANIPLEVLPALP